MTENTFWNALRSKLVPRVYALKLNLRFVKGVPDCWLSGTENDLWLELKYVQTLPPVVDMAKLLSPHQKQWLSERFAEGRSVGALLGSPDGHLFFPALSWQETISREEFLERCVTTRTVAEELIDYLGERVLH